MTSSIWNWHLFTLIQRDKVKWVCVTLNEGYLRSANRGSNNLYRFLIKIYQISLQWKDKFFWSVFFTVFFRLPIYESIAAIFWQSASYVFFETADLRSCNEYIFAMSIFLFSLFVLVSQLFEMILFWLALFDWSAGQVEYF